MTALETNIFPIENLDQIFAKYRLYRVRGLRPEQPEYYQNTQAIIRKVSYSLRTPAQTVMHNDELHLAVRADAEEPESPLLLVRTTAYLDPISETFDLDFTLRTPENDALCARFLQFMLQAPLQASPRLWQPASGQPFFEKSAAESGNSIDRFTGFTVGAVLTPDGGMGLCVDLRTKFVGTRPLPTSLDRDQFRQWKRRHCVYRYGHQWYEIRADELSDLNTIETIIPLDGERVTLFDFIVRNSRKPIPTELAELPQDSAVVHYFNNQGGSRAAPTGLCYPIFDTQSPEVQRSHGKMTPPPHIRRELLHRFAGQYLRRLQFGQTTLQVADAPLKIEQRMFSLPDLQFGGQRRLSVRGTPGTQQVSIDAVGRTRSALLQDRSAGFYVTDPLGRQYYFVPESVADSYGPQFLHDLQRAVDALFPQEHPFDPIVVRYADRGPRTFLDQGKAIIAAAREHCRKPGHALVMIHETRKRRIREQDQLAALVIRELRKLDLCAAVHHTTVPASSYEFRRDSAGEPAYLVRADSRGRFSGYLRNVALNKVLLTNERWPFVLDSPLHADLVIGIDVKAHTAGFTIVGNRGRHIRTICSHSKQKERLHADQVKKYVMELVTAEAQSASEPVRHVVIHRDGRIYQSELEGIRRALEQLKRDNALPADASITIVEIAKSSLIPLRLFEVASQASGKPRIDNPQLGTYFIASPAEGYVCATGRAFPRRGTVQPLHVRHIEGPLSLLQCLEDIYYLTALAWTRPEDCTRYPITIKLTDRRLGEDAGDYDEDAFAFDETEFHAITEGVNS